MATCQKHSRVKKARVLLASFLASLCVLTNAPSAFAYVATEGASGFVSIDFCADQYLLGLAERSDIQAVSYEATGPQSYFADRALGIKTVKGLTEEILLMHPSLVLRTWRGGPRAKDIMDRAGVVSFKPPYALDIAANIQSFEVVGAQIGKAAAAKAYVQTRLAKLADLRTLPRSNLKAVYMTPSGFTAGTGTFVDEIIKLAGFETVAKEADIHYWAPLPLEKMVLSPPDFVIATFFGDPDVLVSHWSSSRHGIYKRLMGDLPVIHVPSRYLSCSGLFAVEAAEFIRSEAKKLGLLGSRGNEK